VSRTGYGDIDDATWLEFERMRIGDRATVIPHPARNGKIALAITPARRATRHCWNTKWRNNDRVQTVATTDRKQSGMG